MINFQDRTESFEEPKNMKTIQTIADLDALPAGCVLTIGNFDGVHMGHRRILSALRRLADECSAPAVVMTFEPHPVAVLHPDKSPGVLTPLALKAALLEASGVDVLFVLKDSFDLLNLAPVAFVDDFLIRRIRPSVVVEGTDFNFGYGRSGDIDTLVDIAAERDFIVEVIQPEYLDLPEDGRKRVSSTLIRHLLSRGSVAQAARALGRPYRLAGAVVRGRGKGAELGFPTINITPQSQIVPDEGVYAGFAQAGDRFEDVCLPGGAAAAALSIGRAKTFIRDHPLLIEAHILSGRVGDLTGKCLAMDFVDRIRGQQRFESSAQLTEQIGRDCETAARILGENRYAFKKRFPKSH